MNQRRITGIKTTVPLGVAFDESGICILESVHVRGFHMQWTLQQFWKLFVVFAGGGELEFEDRNLPVQKDYLVLVPPGNRHRLVDSLREPLSVYIVCISNPELVDRLIPDGKQQVPVWIQSHESAQQAREIIRRIRFEEERRLTGNVPLRHALLAQVLIPMLRESKSAHSGRSARSSATDRIQAYLKTLDSSFFLPDSIDSASERTGMSRRRFTQLIREQCGCSWSDLIRRKRIRYAMQLLKSPDRPVTAIAFECGFEDLSTFYRAFRKETGKKPEACRVKRPRR